MKFFLLSYAFYTLIWPPFFWFFNEDNFNVPIGLRVTFLYLGLAFALGSVSILVYTLFTTKKTDKKHLLMLGLVLLNSLLILLNPWNLIDRFLG